ncbi:HEAT repeat domain-containing protein [Desulfocastanea catecholica]
MTRSFPQVSAVIFFRVLFFVTCCLVITCRPGGAATEVPEKTSTLHITFQDELISADLVDAPLVEVLQRIKEEFGFKVNIHGDVNERLTLSFSDLPLDKCLRLLTVNQSLSVVTEAPPRTSKQEEARRITEIWVLSRSAITKSMRSTPAAPMPASPGPTDTMAVPREDSSEQPEGAGEESVSVEEVLNNPFAERSQQQQAIQELANKGDDESVRALASYLGNEDKEVRQLLVNGIASIQNAQSTQILGQVIQDESDPEIRKIALLALGQRKDDQVAQAFLQKALDDADEEVKTLADQLLTQ